MRDMIEWGSEFVNDQLAEHASQMVTYRRGEEAVDVRATVTRTEFEVERGTVVETYTATSFSFPAEDLVLSTGETEPARGDQVWWLRGKSTIVFELMEQHGGGQAWEKDEFRNRWTVHCKETETL